MGGEAVVGDEGREDDTEERKGRDDNGNEEALLAGTASGLLKEPARFRWAGSNKDEPYLCVAATLFWSCVFSSTAVTRGGYAVCQPIIFRTPGSPRPLIQLEEAEGHASFAPAHDKHRVSPGLRAALKFPPRKRDCKAPSSSRLVRLRLNAGYVGDGVNVG